MRIWWELYSSLVQSSKWNKHESIGKVCGKLHPDCQYQGKRICNSSFKDHFRRINTRFHTRPLSSPLRTKGKLSLLFHLVRFNAAHRNLEARERRQLYPSEDSIVLFLRSIFAVVIDRGIEWYTTCYGHHGDTTELLVLRQSLWWFGKVRNKLLPFLCAPSSIASFTEKSWIVFEEEQRATGKQQMSISLTDRVAFSYAREKNVCRTSGAQGGRAVRP